MLLHAATVPALHSDSWRH